MQFILVHFDEFTLNEQFDKIDTLFSTIVRTYVLRTYNRNYLFSSSIITFIIL